MADSFDSTEEFSVEPSQDAGNYVMTVKLSSDLWEHITQNGFGNATITLGENKVVIDGKVFTFRTTPEMGTNECLLQDGDTFTAVGPVKQKLFFNQELTQKDRKRIQDSAREAEDARKKHKSVFLDTTTKATPTGGMKRVTTISRPKPPIKRPSIQKPLIKRPISNVSTQPRPHTPPQPPIIPRNPSIVQQSSSFLPNSPPQPPVYTKKPPSIPLPKPKAAAPPPAPAPAAIVQPATVASPPTTAPPPQRKNIPKYNGGDVRSAMIHQLAISPLGTQLLANVYGKGHQKMLSSIAVFKAPGLWHLREEMVPELRVDWPDYTPEEREKVRELKASKSSSPGFSEKSPLSPPTTSTPPTILGGTPPVTPPTIIPPSSSSSRQITPPAKEPAPIVATPPVAAPPKQSITPPAPVILPTPSTPTPAPTPALTPTPTPAAIVTPAPVSTPAPTLATTPSYHLPSVSASTTSVPTTPSSNSSSTIVTAVATPEPVATREAKEKEPTPPKKPPLIRPSSAPTTTTKPQNINSEPPTTTTTSANTTSSRLNGTTGHDKPPTRTNKNINSTSNTTNAPVNKNVASLAANTTSKGTPPRVQTTNTTTTNTITPTTTAAPTKASTSAAKTPTPTPTTTLRAPKHAINTSEEYTRCRTEYTAKYDKYKELYDKLEDNRKLFIKLDEELKNARSQPDREAVSAKIEKIYKERHTDIQTNKTKHSELHTELKTLKENMRKYLERNKP